MAKLLILIMHVNGNAIPVAAYDSQEHCNFLAQTLIEQGINAECVAESNQMKQETKTPPATLRDIVRAIETARGVTLYRESTQ
jgi:hypothetical protein